MTWEAIRWKARQKYSELRSLLGGGHYIWQVEPGIRFVARTCDAFSHVFFVAGGHEHLEMRWCRRWLRPAESIVDCGANIGYFSAYLAQAVDLNRIIAVEGNHRTASICADNFRLLGITNTSVVEAILSASESDRLAIPDVRGREPWQRVERVGQDDAAKVLTLDSLCRQENVNPSLVKIDCEGYEPFILQGASRLLEQERPAFMIECNDDALLAAKTNRAQLFAILRRYDYVSFHLASFGCSNPFGMNCDETFPAAEFNFAAIPNDQSALERWEDAARR
jgi:FkbM family methyltransferase